LGCHRFHHGRGIVRGVIVQHQNLKVGVILFLKGLKTGGDVRLFIPGRDEDGDQGGWLGSLGVGAERPQAAQVEGEVEHEDDQTSDDYSLIQHFPLSLAS